MTLANSFYYFITNFFSKKTSPYKILERFNLIRNTSTVMKQTEISNRAKLICTILKENDIMPIIEHKIVDGINIYNIWVHFGMLDYTDRVIHSVHHDVRNINSLNVVDNTGSIANVLALIIDLKGKKLKVNTSFVFTDGEEFGGYGAEIVAQQIKKGEFGNVLGVVVHELSSLGKMCVNEFGFHDYLSLVLYGIDSEMFEYETSYNDVDLYTKAGVNAICLMTIPADQRKEVEETGFCKYWGKCHQMTDDMSGANEKDMLKYVSQLKQFSL